MNAPLYTTEILRLAASLAEPRSLERADGSAELDATSQDSSTRESAVLTPCPPGPDEREKRQLSSASGITIPGRTVSGATVRACPTRPSAMRRYR